MTISMAWVRTVGNMQELVFCTDSRLRFGGYWDCCPKLFPLERGDSAICFAGDTLYAYPSILQIISYINQYKSARNRNLPLEDLKGHLIRILNSMTSLVADLPRGAEEPEVEFILGGYCWKREKFQIWLFHYDKNIRKFTYRAASPWKGGNEEKYLVFAGDYEEDAKARLIELLREKGKINQGGFDLEPLEVLRDMIRSYGKDSRIGGAPQVLKIHKHLNITRYGVFWPNRESNQVSVMGRPLLDYERTDCKIIDLDTLKQGYLAHNDFVFSNVHS